MEELTAVAVVHDSGAAEIADALMPRGQLTATDRQVLAMSAEKADATHRTGAAGHVSGAALALSGDSGDDLPELTSLAGQPGPVRGTRCGPARYLLGR